MSEEMKNMFDSTILDNLYNSLNREVAKKCTLYMPSIKHSPESSVYCKYFINSVIKYISKFKLKIYLVLKARPHEAGYDAFMTGSSKLTYSLFVLQCI